MRLTVKHYTDYFHITRWLRENVPTLNTDQQAQSWAAMMVNDRTYNPNQPIAKNCADGFWFDVPAPASLVLYDLTISDFDYISMRYLP